MERPSCVCLCLLDLAENPLSLWANIGCVHPIVAGHGGCHGCPRTILAPLFDLALGGVNGARGQAATVKSSTTSLCRPYEFMPSPRTKSVHSAVLKIDQQDKYVWPGDDVVEDGWFQLDLIKEVSMNLRFLGKKRRIWNLNSCTGVVV